jgi:hypothetical protein
MIAPANKPMPRFNLGRCLVTPGAFNAMAESHEAPGDFLDRHMRGDWDDVDAHDRQANEDALKTGARIWSTYKTRKGVKLRVITEADRSSTTILLPSEY